MARMIPDVSLEQISYPSERIVYEALKQLPDPYIVLHSYPWLRPQRDLANEPLGEGEADFVVLHPKRGLLILEVKGGEPILQGGIWYRGSNEIRDPFQQAQRSRYALLDAIEKLTKHRIQRNLFPHGYAVAFPHCIYHGQLPLNADPRTFIDARGLGNITLCIEEAFSAWERKPTALSTSQFRELIETLLPKLRLLRCVGADIAAEGARIIQVTEDQHATLMGLLANERVLVEGVAGSGKTLLALEFAVTLASSGNKTLLLCFNRHLADWLLEQAHKEPRAIGSPGMLDVNTFHSLALGLARRARVEFRVPKQHDESFWNDEAPLILEQAIEILGRSNEAPQYDAIVVDEGQDFFRDWWITVESLSRGGRHGRLYVFLDLHQSLRGETRKPPVPLPTQFPLSTNCRNTRAIAQTAGRLIQTTFTILPSLPDGELPHLRYSPTQTVQASLVMSSVRDLIKTGIQPYQIAIIGPASFENGSLASQSTVDGIPLITDAVAWRLGKGILVTTARAFKGLEADIVILYDLTSFSPVFTKTDLYVAWTRARHRLIAICQKSGVSAEIESVLAGFAKSTESTPIK
ncbi:MAG: NERD domain-containing protein/DEAD/DEAH box helicase [Acidobacteria bacterium]|nr:NERD domain-containing protein/DEAD/DEAH box helicase [Acidobacteriota bacterium]